MKEKLFFTNFIHLQHASIVSNNNKNNIIKKDSCARKEWLVEASFVIGVIVKLLAFDLIAFRETTTILILLG